MDPLSAILGALLAGATAATSEVASKAVGDAYQALKTILVDSYQLASASLLERKPSNQAYRQAVEAELKENPEIANDAEVLERATALQDALRRESPAQLAAWGIDIKDLEAGGSIIAERVLGGVRGERWRAASDIRLSDIAVDTGAGSSKEK